MEINVKKKIFNVKDGEIHKTTLSIPAPMFNALAKLGEFQNESVPWVIMEALEAYLVHAATKEVIDWPKHYKVASVKKSVG